MATKEEMLISKIKEDSREMLSSFNNIVEYLSDSSMGQCWDDDVSKDIEFLRKKLDYWAYDALNARKTVIRKTVTRKPTARKTVRKTIVREPAKKSVRRTVRRY